MSLGTPIKATPDTPPPTWSGPGGIASFKGLKIYGLTDFHGMHANGV